MRAAVEAWLSLVESSRIVGEGEVALSIDTARLSKSPTPMRYCRDAASSRKVLLALHRLATVSSPTDDRWRFEIVPPALQSRLWTPPVTSIP